MYSYISCDVHVPNFPTSPPLRRSTEGAAVGAGAKEAGIDVNGDSSGSMVGSLSHHVQGFIHPTWLFEISYIKCAMPETTASENSWLHR